MRVLVLGAGAIGCLFGASLAAGGVSVHLVGRPAVAEAIRRTGLQVEGRLRGTFHVPASDRIPANAQPEAVLIAVKTFDLASAAADLAGSVAAPVPTLLPQNGLSAEVPAEEAMRGAGWPRPQEFLVRAVNTVPATLLGPGAVRAAGSGEVLLPEAQGPHAGATRLWAGLLREAGIRTRTVRDISLEVWRKAIVNAAINPVTALHGVPNGALRSGPLHAEAQELLSEAWRVAQASGFGLGLAELGTDLDRVTQATAENRSSMLQDIDRGRPTEIDAISGEILRRGEGFGLDLPATRRALAAVTARAAARRGQLS